MTIILAKIFGFYCVALGLAFLINPSKFKKLYPQMLKDQLFIFFGGLLALLIGAFIVSVHNVWVWDWPVILTILGWWGIVKGYLLIIHPGAINYFSFILNRSETFFRILGIFWTALGAFFIYQGWRGSF